MSLGAYWYYQARPLHGDFGRHGNNLRIINFVAVVGKVRAVPCRRRAVVCKVLNYILIIGMKHKKHTEREIREVILQAKQEILDEIVIEDAINNAYNLGYKQAVKDYKKIKYMEKNGSLKRFITSLKKLNLTT